MDRRDSPYKFSPAEISRDGGGDVPPILNSQNDLNAAVDTLMAHFQQFPDIDVRIRGVNPTAWDTRARLYVQIGQYVSRHPNAEYTGTTYTNN